MMRAIGEASSKADPGSEVYTSRSLLNTSNPYAEGVSRPPCLAEST